MSANSTPGKPGNKSMSSRLLTMKFMQRAAASSPIASPSTPSTPEGPPLKRRKQGKDHEEVAFDVDELANQAKIRAVMEEEAAKQQALMDKVAAEAGESRWVLNFEEDQETENDSTPIRVLQTGFADIDRGLSRRITKSEEDDDDEIRERHDRMGRRSFGRFNRVIEKLQNPDAEDSSESSSEDEKDNKPESDSDDSDDDGTSALLKEERAAALQKLKDERKKQRKKDRGEAVKLAEKRKRKDVNLNGLTSLSNSGPVGGFPRKPVDTSNVTCYNCQQVGHIASDCPNSKSFRRGPDVSGDPKPKRARKSY